MVHCWCYFELCPTSSCWHYLTCFSRQKVVLQPARVLFPATPTPARFQSAPFSRNSARHLADSAVHFIDILRKLCNFTTKVGQKAYVPSLSQLITPAVACCSSRWAAVAVLASNTYYLVYVFLCVAMLAQGCQLTLRCR